MALPEYTASEDGFELQFASNHLAHFLLVNLLVPKLLPEGSDASEKRIVNVSSSAYSFAGVRFDDVNYGVYFPPSPPHPPANKPRRTAKTTRNGQPTASQKPQTCCSPSHSRKSLGSAG